MYHRDRKEQYLKETGKANETQIVNLFNRLGAYETEIGKDLCDMNLDELINLLKPYSFSTMVYMRSQFHDYNKWCLSKQYSHLNYADPKILATEMLKEINDISLHDVYLSPEKYTEVIRVLGRVPERQVLIPIFLCIYEGVVRKNFNDLIFLRLRDIEQDIIHTHRGKSIMVSHTLVKYLRSCGKLTHEPSRWKKKPLYVDSIYSDSVFKMTRTCSDSKKPDVMKRRFRIYMEKISRYTGITLSISELSNSGIFNYVSEMAMSEYGLDFRFDLKSNQMSDFARQTYESLLSDKGIDVGILQYKIHNKFIDLL